MNYNDTILDLELLTLSQQERQHLVKVIERDERLRRLQNEKIKHLRELIANIEINSLNIPKEDIQIATNCILCCSKFTFIINTGVFCAVCGYKYVY
jgi:Rab effector MyRIP